MVSSCICVYIFHLPKKLSFEGKHASSNNCLFSIKYRIEFKIVLLTFKCLYGLAPQYLADLIAVAPQSRYNLRSRNATLLVSAKARCLPTLGNRAFQSAAPKLWNSLPAEIRNIQTLASFKRALKTYFLKRAF